MYVRAPHTHQPPIIEKIRRFNYIIDWRSRQFAVTGMSREIGDRCHVQVGAEYVMMEEPASPTQVFFAVVKWNLLGIDLRQIQTA